MWTKSNATSTCRFITTIRFFIFLKTLNEVIEEKSFEVWVFFGSFGKKSRSNGANWKAIKGMEQSHAKGQIVEMGMQRETSLQPRRVYCSNHIYLDITWKQGQGQKSPKDLKTTSPSSN